MSINNNYKTGSTEEQAERVIKLLSSINLMMGVIAGSIISVGISIIIRMP